MKLRVLHTVVALTLAANALAGCYVTWGDDTPRAVPVPVPFGLDDDAPPRFTFTLSRGCSALQQSACGTDRPLMAGVRERVVVSIPGSAFGPEPVVRVSDPGVLTVGELQRLSSSGERYQAAFDLRGVAAGVATLTVTGSDGRDFAFTVRVDEPAGMDIVEDEGTSQFDRDESRLRVRVGQRISLTGYPVNLNVERLYANDGVSWTVPTAERVNLSWSFMSGPRVVDDHVYLTGVAPGREVVTVRAGVVERTVIVDVTN
jgi:hypothetical protein